MRRNSISVLVTPRFLLAGEVSREVKIRTLFHGGKGEGGKERVLLPERKIKD